MMMNKLRRNAKALSPIFAVLILIAISVIAGIVVYMFTSGTIATMTGGGTTGQEKAAVQGVDPTNAIAYAQNTGGVAITLTDWIIKDAGGNIVDSGQICATTPGTPEPVMLPVSGELTEVPFEVTALDTLPASTYTVTLVSAKGGSFVSPSFSYVPAGP